jgi:DNA-binding Lrp family transcriptional regulator
MSSTLSSPSVRIVDFLKRYGAKSVPLGFVAQSLGRRTPEIVEDVTRLEQEGILRRDGDNVRLTEEAASN